jgi:hypothetical protein
MSQFATFLAILGSVVAFIFWLIRDDKWIASRYTDLIDLYQITLMICLAFLAPLLVIKPLRRILHPLLAIARATLLFCWWAICFLAVYILWGNTAVTIGLILGWVGGIPMALIACLTKASWTLLGHIFLSFIGYFSCFMAEITFDPYNQKIDSSRKIPQAIIQASNAIWVCLILATPGLIQLSLNESYGALILILSVLLYTLLAIGIRKGFKIASAAYTMTIVPFAGKYLLSISSIDLHGILKAQPDAFLGLFQFVQSIIALYALAMIFSPEAFKWIWFSQSTEPNHKDKSPLNNQ